MKNYSELSKQDLNSVLCTACFNNDLNLIKEIFNITKAKKCNNTIPKNMLLIAAEQGYLDIIEYMINSEELNNIISAKFKKYLLKDAFKVACSNGKLDIVEYLLNSSELNLKKKPNGIEAGFYEACKNGHLKIINYLFKQELGIKSNFPAFEYGVTLAVRNGHNHVLKYFFETNYSFALKTLKNSTILYTAESNDKIDVIKYLLTSPDLKDKIHIHEDNDIIYKCAHNGTMLNVLRYLIVDFNIEKTKDIAEHLKKFPNEAIEKMFDFHDLVNNLQFNDAKTKKPKV
jgi:ankyrin repeat protein